MVETTSMDITSEAFARRLATLLAERRRQRGKSLRSLAKASGRAFSAHDLKDFEAGVGALDGERLDAIVRLYDADIHSILPTRVTLDIKPFGVLSTSGLSAPFIPDDSTSLLLSYLKLVRQLRAQQKAPAIELRREDVESLASFLGESGSSVVERLGALMGASQTQRRAMAGVFLAGAVVIGLTSGSAAAGDERADGSNAAVGSSGAATTIVVDAPEIGNGTAAPSSTIWTRPTTAAPPSVVTPAIAPSSTLAPATSVAASPTTAPATSTTSTTSTTVAPSGATSTGGTPTASTSPASPGAAATGTASPGTVAPTATTPTGGSTVFDQPTVPTQAQPIPSGATTPAASTTTVQVADAAPPLPAAPTTTVEVSTGAPPVETTTDQATGTPPLPPLPFAPSGFRSPAAAGTTVSAWKVLSGAGVHVQGGAVRATGFSRLEAVDTSFRHGWITVDATLSRGPGFGIYVRTAFDDRGHVVSGWSVQVDTGWNKGALLLRRWTNDWESHPVAVTDVPRERLYGAHELVVGLEGDMLRSTWNGASVVLDLGTALDGLGPQWTGPRPSSQAPVDHLGVRTWGDTDLVVGAFHVAD